MSKEAKIKQILEAVKIDVEDISEFEKDIDSVLQMFNEIKDVDVENIPVDLIRKKIHISDLRDDIPRDAGFRKEMRGKYYKVPNVSKK